VALTTPRLIVTVAAVAAVIAVALLPPAPGLTERTREPPYSRIGALATATGQAETKLRILQLETLAGRAAARHGEMPGFWLEHGNARPGILRRERAAWDSVATSFTGATGSAGLLVLRDRGPGTYRQLTIHVLPAAATRRTCIAVHDYPYDGWLEAIAVARALGVCWFYGMLGPPGPGVESWLLATNGAPAYEPWVSHAPGEDGPDADLLSQANLSLMSFVDFQATRQYLGTLEETACAGGRLAYCDSVWSAGGRYSFPGRWTRISGRHLTVRTAPLGSWWSEVSHQFLADLFLQYGAERFTRFWRSDAPVDSAFVAAFGGSRAAVMSAWLNTKRRVRVGPAVSFASVAISLLCGIVLLGVAGWYTNRRTVS
jgi:hypothetical protein